jgi:hypothetical protein
MIGRYVGFVSLGQNNDAAVVRARARVRDQVRHVAPQPEQAAEADEPPHLDVEAKVAAHGAVILDVGDPGWGASIGAPFGVRT